MWSPTTKVSTNARTAPMAPPSEEAFKVYELLFLDDHLLAALLDNHLTLL
jgi:hypothetical protein